MPCPHQGVLPLVFESSFSIQAGSLSRKRQAPCFCDRALRETDGALARYRFPVPRGGIRDRLVDFMRQED